tara:strand:- start:2600 stop:3019 length:420 start_codon:yes stop_codon:yes gene_type:complete
MNIKYFVSYLGLVPFILLIIDGYFLGMLDINFIINLSIMMACIIFTFIGAYNWNFEKDNTFLEVYGFMPSLISMIILLLNIFKFNQTSLILFLIMFLLVQLLIDFYRTLKCTFPMRYFIKLRLPVTSTLCVSLLIISYL